MDIATYTPPIKQLGRSNSPALAFFMITTLVQPCISQAMSAPGNATGLLWQADLQNGDYRNPILYADYSDPDVVQHEEDYWMTASSFSHVPGLPILHSRDLVNWRLVNHALRRLVPADHYRKHRAGDGVWAPCIRFHDGKFWIFYPDPDFGIYVITAEDPGGKWTPPHLLKAGKGLIDPSPLWDDDGRAWLVHALARSRAGRNNVLILNEITPDATQVLDEDRIIIDGHQLPGWRTLEGPKFYKHNGWYWIFAPAGGVAEGYQAVFRAHSIEGPYQERIVLEQGSTEINGPHQGAWVRTPSGEDWFLHFQEKLPFGRIVHLQPMFWQNDGWPAMGHDPRQTGTGEPVLRHKKPDLPQQVPAYPHGSDSFDQQRIGLQWQWQANPCDGWSSLSARPGWLRLQCVAHQPEQTAPLWTAPHLLLQKFASPTFTATTRLDFSAAKHGDSAGMIVFGYDYIWIGLVRTESGWQLERRTCTNAHQGNSEVIDTATLAPSPVVELQLQLVEDGLCRFAFRFDDGPFLPFGEPFKPTASRWVGSKFGIFAAAQNSSPEAASSHADFEYFAVLP